MANFGDISYTFGCLWAMLIQQAIHPKIISGNAIGENWWKRIARWLIAVIGSMIFITVMGWLQETDGFIPTYSLLFSAITCKLCCAFSFFLVADLISYRLGLINMVPYDAEEGDADGEHLANEAENDEDKSLLKNSNQNE